MKNNKVFIIGSHADIVRRTLENHKDVIVINDDKISDELEWNDYVSKITNYSKSWLLNNDNKSILDKYFDITRSRTYEIFKSHYDNILAKTSKLSKAQREVVLELHKAIYK